CTSTALFLDYLCNANVIRNNISNNSGRGIATLNTNGVSILNNTLINSGQFNTHLCASGSYLICYNQFVLNQGIQIEFWSGGSSSIIHHNNFILLGDYLDPYTSQALDLENQTYWYDTATLEGNYWSDFDWNPGIAYQIAGEGSNTDPYPLETPVTF
ncbi:MAG: NosD domain-containing protein, partial [Candidatus Heimdallarchaeota archaeon]